MVIWSGWGILVPMFPLLTCFAAYSLKDSLFGVSSEGVTNMWPAVVGMFAAAVITWFMGIYFRNRENQVFQDPNTGQEFVVHKKHSLYFISMHWWGVIFLILSLLFLGLQVTHK